MTSLCVRIEINKGGIGASLYKLAQISSEYEKFLKLFSRDLHLDLRQGDWVAKDFENHSVEYTVEYIGPITPVLVKDSNAALKYIMNETSDFVDLSTRISRATVLQYARIAKEIDPDEMVEFGLYSNGNNQPTDIFRLSKQRALEIEQRLKIDDTISYSTSIQGRIHSLFKEVDRPHFKLRELTTGELITCFYPREIYDQIAKALQNKEAIIHVAGWVTASRETRKPLHINIEKLHIAEEYFDGDLEKFFGCAPYMVEDDSIDELPV